MVKKYKDKRVFVTGHTGFKGSWLCSFLDVLGASHAGYSLKPSTNPSHSELLKSNKNSFIGNLSDVEYLTESMQKFQPEL